MNKLFELLKSKLFVKKSLKFEKNVIKATAKITPGIAYPEIEKVVMQFKILVFDIPLLLENKSLKNNYILIYIDAKKKDINKRLRKRKNFNKKIIKMLRKSQLPLEIKKKKSDYIIKNDFNRLNLKKRVKILVKKLLI